MVLLLIFYSIYIFYIGGRDIPRTPYTGSDINHKTIKPYFLPKSLISKALKIWFYFCGIKKTLFVIFLLKPAQF